MGAIALTAMMAILIIFDQLSKFAAVKWLKPIGSADFIPHLLNLHYVENRGAAFSMLSGATIFLLLITGAVLVLCMVALYKNLFEDRFVNFCLALIIAGGWGNFIDRAVQGYVVDFFNVLPFQFPVFNVADCYVVVGVVLLIVYMLFFNRDLLKEKNHEQK